MTRFESLWPRLHIGRGESGYPRSMSASQLSPEGIRAAAEAHRELGPEYHDAVVESFLAKVEKEIEARIEARLANPPAARRRQVDPATMAKRRLMLNHMALGSLAAGIPLSFVVFAIQWQPGAERAVVLVWILIAAVYAVCAIRLRPSRRDHE
jgi:hypothetical protein